MSYNDSESVPLNHWLFAKNQLKGFILDKPNPESNLSYKGSCPVPRVLDKPWQPQLGSLKIYLCTSDKTPRSKHYIGIIDEQLDFNTFLTPLPVYNVMYIYIQYI